MSRHRNVEYSWSGIRAVLSHSLKQIDIDPKDSLDWLSFCWALIVGKEIAAVSQVNKVSPKTLYIDVAGKEWLPALKALQEKIIEEMRQQAGCEKLARIVFKVISAPIFSGSPPGASVNNNAKSDPHLEEFQGQSKR